MKTKNVSNIVVGKPAVKHDASSHVKGVFEGNRHHPTQRKKGTANETEARADGDARRSTGIRPDEHDTIDPRMPKLSPA